MKLGVAQRKTGKYAANYTCKYFEVTRVNTCQTKNRSNSKQLKSILLTFGIFKRDYGLEDRNEK